MNSKSALVTVRGTLNVTVATTVPSGGTLPDQDRSIGAEIRPDDGIVDLAVGQQVEIASARTSRSRGSEVLVAAASEIGHVVHPVGVGAVVTKPGPHVDGMWTWTKGARCPQALPRHLPRPRDERHRGRRRRSRRARRERREGEDR